MHSRASVPLEEQTTYANLRNVWTIATGAFKDAHFATFPTALVEPCIKAGTSERGVCPECGAPWLRNMEPATGKASRGMATRTIRQRGSQNQFCQNNTCLRKRLASCNRASAVHPARCLPNALIPLAARAPSAWLRNAWAGTASQSRSARITPTRPGTASRAMHRC